MGARILVPLCGKTVDMAFLARSGYRVLGIDCVKNAVDEFAAEHSATGEAVPVHLPKEVDVERFKAHAMMPKPAEGEDWVGPTPRRLGTAGRAVGRCDGGVL